MSDWFHGADVSYVRHPSVFRARGETGEPLDKTLKPSAERGFKLVFVRIHFVGGSGTADVVLSLDSIAGEEYDVTLFKALVRGVDADLNLIVTQEERSDPSPWSFQPGDGLRVQWVNPSTTSWGIEIGYETV